MFPGGFRRETGGASTGRASSGIRYRRLRQLPVCRRAGLALAPRRRGRRFAAVRLDGRRSFGVAARKAELPSGAVTFLFSDVEGSTVRMGFHTDEAGIGDDDYGGLDVHRAAGSARLATVARR